MTARSSIPSMLYGSPTTCNVPNSPQQVHPRSTCLQTVFSQHKYPRTLSLLFEVWPATATIPAHQRSCAHICPLNLDWPSERSSQIRGGSVNSLLWKENLLPVKTGRIMRENILLRAVATPREKHRSMQSRPLGIFLTLALFEI